MEALEEYFSQLPAEVKANLCGPQVPDPETIEPVDIGEAWVGGEEEDGNMYSQYDGMEDIIDVDDPDIVAASNADATMNMPGVRIAGSADFDRLKHFISEEAKRHRFAADEERRRFQHPEDPPDNVSQDLGYSSSIREQERDTLLSELNSE